jgi:hypothetical protein
MKNYLNCSLLLALPLLLAKTCNNIKVARCYASENVALNWTNDYTEVQDRNSQNVVVDSYRIYPNGIFNLNKDGTYHVISNGVPFDGKWMLNPDCSLTLDKNSTNERKFTILKLDADSLVISRRDDATSTNYTQHYSKTKN